jgi:hypothetical protein
MKDDDATRHRATPWPPAHRAPLDDDAPPALHHFRGGGGEGVAPHVACGDYLHQHKSF